MTAEPTRVPAPQHRRRADWLVPAALIFLSLIPTIAGAARITELAGGGPVNSENARFFASPVPVVTHIIGATVFSLLGAFQFFPPLRRGKRSGPSWHRVAGRVLVPAGLLAALSGLWMAVFYDLPPSDGEILLILRLIFGSAMVASIVLGFLAVRRRDFARHSAWMTRGYAIGLGAGTQAVVMLPWLLLIGPIGEVTRAALMGASWVLNLAVAEYVVYRREQRAGQAPRPSGRSIRPYAGAAQ
ncbi:MAG: hypothetical protein JWO49_2098 [Arthrobacter sp.]|nr:hypothetical protein [Arthrobacter sp.]